MTGPSHRVLATQIADADPITDRSPHLCRSTRAISSLTLGVPLLPSIDQWGYLPFPLQRLTPHSLSRLVHSMLAGDLGAHRDLPADTEDTVETEQPVSAPVTRLTVRSGEDSRRAWARRRANIDSLAGVDDLLNEVDAQLEVLERRTTAILTERADPN